MSEIKTTCQGTSRLIEAATMTYEEYSNLHTQGAEELRAAYEALQTEVTRLQREVVNRNQRALDGDKAIKTQDALLVEVEALQKENESLKWQKDNVARLGLKANEALKAENAAQAKRIEELEQAASINQEYIIEMLRINGMAINAGLKVPNPNSPYFSERSAIAYLQRQSYEQGWKDGNNNVKLMDHKD